VKRPDIIVVGAGVTGLLTALKLHESGLQPLVASAGSEPGYDEFPLPDVAVLPAWQRGEWVDRLEMRSAELLPELVTGLGQATGVDCAMSRVDLLVAGEPGDDAVAWLEACDHHWQKGPLTDFDSNLAMGQSPGVKIEGLISLRQARLARALNLYLRQRGIEVIEHDPVRRLDVAGNIVLGIELTSGTLRRAEATVVAAAEQTGALLFDSGLERIAGTGSRESALVFAPAVAALHNPVWVEELWLQPMSDGRLLAGAVPLSSGDEHMGLSALLERVYDWLPALGRHDLQQRGSLEVAGPGTRPSIGSYPGVRGLWINGHHEVFGPLVAPAAAEFLAEQLAGSRPVPQLAVRILASTMQPS